MDASRLRNEIYDYFFQTVSQLGPSPSETNSTTLKVMEVIEKTGVFYTTIFGWFLVDQEYNNNELKYLSVSIVACVSRSRLPKPDFLFLSFCSAADFGSLLESPQGTLARILSPGNHCQAHHLHVLVRTPK